MWCAASVARKALVRANQLGFDFSTFFDLIEREIEHTLDRSRAELNCSQWIHNNYVLYQGVREYLTGLLLSKIKVFILTFGKESFQRMKFGLFGFPRSVDVVCESTPMCKYHHLQRFHNQLGGQIIFVDDSVFELDAVRVAGIKSTDVETVRIIRPESPDAPHFNAQGKFHHREIGTLSELF